MYLTSRSSPMTIERSNDVIAISRLAECFGIDKTGCRRWLHKDNFALRFARLEERGNQLCAVLPGRKRCKRSACARHRDSKSSNYDPLEKRDTRIPPRTGRSRSNQVSLSVTEKPKEYLRMSHSTVRRTPDQL